MCHKNLTLRCSTCHKPSPRHRCHCPAKHPSSQHDAPPTYATVMGTQPPPSAPFPASRCGPPTYRGCGYQRRQCRGPIRLLIGLVMRKVQEKREERGRLGRDVGGETGGWGQGQEEGVVESWDEKGWEGKGGREEEEAKKGGDVEVVGRSVRSLSL
ncbi:hypothetical protein BDR22DRAFT_817643 [Usnea florida]